MSSNSRHGAFFIDGAWVKPAGRGRSLVIDPSTEEAFAEIAMGSAADVDRAAAAAHRAFPAYAATSVASRVALLNRIAALIEARADELATLISREMGAPIAFCRQAQVPSGRDHFIETARALERLSWEESRGATRIIREPIGVCGLITPWNWPLNQIACKVAPALAAGCAMVLKPSEVAPLDALLFAEILKEAGVPDGVFNLVNGDGPNVGEAMSRHPMIDMMSFTGSTRAGAQVARGAADTIKRVHQELGGKSPNIVLADAPLDAAVANCVANCFNNNGQSCDAPTRLFVPRDRHQQAATIAAKAAAAFVVGAPSDPKTTLGPVVSAVQYERIQRLIEAGVTEGAQLVAGGVGRPESLNRGWYVRPTVFAGVDHRMTISREEIFGPVLSILPYDNEETAIALANDTPYGLAAYVQGESGHARAVARRLRAGVVYLNEPAGDLSAPFGGYKQSGNGREYGEWGLEAYLEVKGVLGWGA